MSPTQPQAICHGATGEAMKDGDREETEDNTDDWQML